MNAAETNHEPAPMNYEAQMMTSQNENVFITSELNVESNITENTNMNYHSFLTKQEDLKTEDVQQKEVKPLVFPEFTGKYIASLVPVKQELKQICKQSLVPVIHRVSEIENVIIEMKHKNQEAKPLVFPKFTEKYNASLVPVTQELKQICKQSLVPVIHRVSEIENAIIEMKRKNQVSKNNESKLLQEEAYESDINVKKKEHFLIDREYGEQEEYPTFFVCHKCSLCFRTKHSLEEHVLSSHSYKCDWCSEAFSLKHSLRDHIQNVHSKQKNICKECYKSYDSVAALKGHKQVHVKKKLQLYVCYICAVSFKTKRGFMLHEFLHTGLKPFICEICKKTFRTKPEVKIHIDCVHSKLPRKNVKCNDCGAVYPSKDKLRFHKCILKYSEESVQPLTCAKCDKTFTERKLLIGHVRTHTDTRLFPCRHCGKPFTQASHRQIHERIHTGEMPYTCDECGKRFRDKSNLKVHKIFHSGKRPFSCEECGKAYTQWSHLNMHKRTHSDARDYVCNICGQAFKTRLILTQHIYTHLDNKPLHCNVCGRSFIQSNHFRKHRCDWRKTIVHNK